MLPTGGFIFAEHPEIVAPQARIIWHAAFDPGTLQVVAESDEGRADDRFDPTRLAPWLTSAMGASGIQHVVLSNGWHRIRLDVAGASLTEGRPVVLRYLLHGMGSTEPKLLPLRRLLDLHRHRRFARSLYPADRRVDRLLAVLRTHDALRAGASQREIACVLFGSDEVRNAWDSGSGFLRSRVRRLTGSARQMARGGFRSLLRGRGGGGE